MSGSSATTSASWNVYRNGGNEMKIAIIGTGIAGNVAAYKLRQRHDITVFESASYIGGHTNTVTVEDGGRELAIDTGFIVFNDRTYQNFIQLLDEIGQSSQRSEMSFSVQANHGALEYNGASLNALFAQRRNFLRPSFYRMVRDILRFNEQALYGTGRLSHSQTLRDFLLENHYSAEFVENYLVPMAAAIWSAESRAVLDMPVSFLIRFFDHHGLLQLKDRPVWRTIEGGSREYVKKLVAKHHDQIRLKCPVYSVRRLHNRVDVVSAAGQESFDAAFLACHSDQALAMLQDPTPAEQDVLGAIRYQHNEAILHTDASVMPKRRRAWAAWNYHLPEDGGRAVSVTYNMNILQRLEARQQYCVSLNSASLIDDSKVIKRIDYDHPIYSRKAVAAQARQQELNSNRTFYCGAYWRNGFHEDGVVSALHAVQHFEEGLANAKLHLRRAG